MKTHENLSLLQMSHFTVYDIRTLFPFLHLFSILTIEKFVQNLNINQVF